jgi:hypothetical protein
MRFILCSLLLLSCATPTCYAQVVPPDLKANALVVPNTIASKVIRSHVSVLVALDLTNQSPSSVFINKFDGPLPILTTKSGRRLTTDSWIDGTVPVAKNYFVHLRQGETTYICMSCYLKIEGQTFSLMGQTDNGVSWAIKGLMPGSYNLILDYEPKKNILSSELRQLFGNEQPWYGKMLSDPTTFTIE